MSTIGNFETVSGVNEPITEAPAQTLVEKVEETVEAAVQAAETEAVQVEQAVVAEVEKVVAFVETEAKEGYVAAENLVRKVLNHHISAGGGSVIRNPA